MYLLYFSICCDNPSDHGIPHLLYPYLRFRLRFLFCFSTANCLKTVVNNRKDYKHFVNKCKHNPELLSFPRHFFMYITAIWFPLSFVNSREKRMIIVSRRACIFCQNKGLWKKKCQHANFWRKSRLYKTILLFRFFFYCI